MRQIPNKSSSDDLDDNYGEIVKAPEMPGVSGIDLGQHTNRKSVELIRAQGEEKELSACLQMIAEYYNLPFRKDTVEKIIEDNISRGKRPVLTCVEISLVR